MSHLLHTLISPLPPGTSPYAHYPPPNHSLSYPYVLSYALCMYPYSLSHSGCTTGVPTPEKRSQISWQEHAKKVKQDQAFGRRSRLLSSADIRGIPGGLSTTGGGGSVSGSVGGGRGSPNLLINDLASISSAGTLSLSPDTDNGTRRRLTVINAATAQSSSVINMNMNSTSPNSLLRHRSNSTIAAPLIALGRSIYSTLSVILLTSQLTPPH